MSFLNILISGNLVKLSYGARVCYLRHDIEMQRILQRMDMARQMLIRTWVFILQNLESDQLVLLLEEVLEIPKISHCTLGLLYDTYDLGQRNADVSRDIFVE